MSQQNQPTRRSFLKTSGLGIAGLAVPAAWAFGASEAIRVGCIGTGGRCRALMKSLGQIENVRITGICDAYDAHLDLARPLADPKALATRSYREILERKDIDAVLIGTPDHWHVPMTVEACAAGKDVYVEKPLTHSLDEGKVVIEAQDRHKRIVQVGTQQRSMPQFEKARELLRAGRLGKIHKVHLTWNRNTDRVRKNAPRIDPKNVDWKAFLGNAPEQPFDEYRLRNWRWFWDFGGGIFTDLMVHFIDVVHWFLETEHPLQAASIGQHVLAKDIWQTPDTVQTLLTYPNDLQVHFEGNFCNARSGAMLEFLGADATLYLDRGCYQIFPERNKGEPEEWVLGTNLKRGLDFYDKPDGEYLHLKNWIDCIRSRRKPSAPAEAGVSAAAAAHLANQALRTGQVVRWQS
ncbi:MAG: Gfo/Idh/MocA family oxidoreductase [Planctomycetia bacterium]|nr:Gfo/Idh/MocA family oxidoreductase [Planctomycetia bacterium]